MKHFFFGTVGRRAATLTVLTVCMLSGYKVYSIMAAIAAATAHGPPPDAVTTAIARSETWRGMTQAVGSLVPVQGITVSSEMQGRVVEIGFESGAKVNQGDLLIKLDTSVEEAQLKAASAKLELARLSFNRASALKRGDVMSVASFDSAKAELQAAIGEDEALKATIAKKTIRAPFGGMTGVRLVNLGQVINAGTEIVSLQSSAELYVRFSLPQSVAPLLKIGAKVGFTVDAYPEGEFTGSLTAMNPDVNPQTRNILLQASFLNPSGELRAGMFGKVTCELPNDRQLLVLPATSIQHAPYGDSVFIVRTITGEDGKEYIGVEQQFIKIAESRGDFVGLELREDGGLKVGDEVVTSGLFKLRPKAAVLVNNSTEIHPSLSPQPQDT